MISKNNFEKYFGPFAGRAFRKYKIEINNCSRSMLVASGCSEKVANAILDEKKRNG